MTKAVMVRDAVHNSECMTMEALPSGVVLKKPHGCLICLAVKEVRGASI